MNLKIDILEHARKEILACNDIAKILVLSDYMDILRKRDAARLLHIHNSFELRLLFRDMPEDGKPFTPLQEICLTPPGVMHLTLCREELQRHLTIRMDPMELYYVCGCHFIYTRGLDKSPNTEGFSVVEILTEINRCTHSEKLEVDYLRVLLGLLISHALHLFSFQDKDTIQQPAALIAAYIRENYYRADLSIREIAEATHYSPNYIQKVFRLGWNCTPIEYLNHIRLSQAQLLLKQHRYRVKEVASLCGWNYVHYFCRKYREFFGHSPSREI